MAKKKKLTASKNKTLISDFKQLLTKVSDYKSVNEVVLSRLENMLAKILEEQGAIISDDNSLKNQKADSGALQQKMSTCIAPTNPKNVNQQQQEQFDRGVYVRSKGESQQADARRGQSH